MVKLKLMKTVKASSARTLFILHSLLAVSRVASVYGDRSYWLLASLLLLIVAEGFMNIYFRGGNETVGFCPCVFLYLCSVVPAIWLLELDLGNKADNHHHQGDTNTSSHNELEDLLVFNNLTDNSSLFAQILEQLLLVFLIIGRWLLPKGELSRDELSQLLLVYVGTAADIAELFETFKEPQVEGLIEIRYAILLLWSWSLLQFTIVLPNSVKSRRRVGKKVIKDPDRKPPQEGIIGWWRWLTTNMDIWGILISTCLQDGPFLSIRLFLLIKHRVISYMMIFFTCKNTLVLLLQLYRLFVLISQHKKSVDRAKRAANAHKRTLHITVPNSDSPHMIHRLESTSIMV